MDPTTEEDPSFDADINTNDVTPMADANALSAPTITLKQDDKTIQSGAEVPHGTSNVTFELTGAAGADLYYKIDGEPEINDANKYANAVRVTAPTETAKTTVTIKAVAYIKAVGTEGEEGYVAAQTSLAATATVVFLEKGKTISVADGSDAAEVKIGGTTITGTDEYPITSTGKDIDVAVAADSKVFEVMYNEDGGTWTSALKKGKKANNPFADRAVSFGSGTYTIPKAALTKDVKIKVCYLKEITLDWQGDANWESVHIEAETQRVGSDSKNWIGLFGAQFPETKKDKENVLFVPQNTKVTLALSPVEGVDFTFDTVTVGKTGESGTAVTLPTDKKSASVEIADIGTDDYTVTINGTSTTYARTVVKEKDGDEFVSFNKNGLGTIEPRKEYTIRALVAGGQKTYPISALEVTCGKDDVSKLVILTENKTSEGEAATVDGTYTLKALAAAGGKTLVVTVKGEDKTLTTFKLAVAPVITTVTVAKATGKDKDTITQSIGAQESYELTLAANEKTSKDELDAQIKDNVKDLLGEAKVQVVNGKTMLSITTKSIKAEGASATIDIINKSAEEGEKEVVKTLTVNAANPAWTAKTPTVKLVNATDVILNLDLTLPKDVDKTAPQGTKYYYKVEPKVQTATKKNGFTYLESAVFVEASTDAVTTKESLKVIDKKFGEGTDAKFDVTVQLLQYTVASSNPDDSDQHADSDKPAGMNELIASSKAVTVKNLATKAPYYADKITLKKTKAASGVYTGQTIDVATIDFGKNTTYNRDGDVKAEVIDGSTDSIEPEVKNGSVQLTVPKGTKPGKYTIRITQTVAGSDGVEADYGIPAEANPTSATVQVTVVQGIKDITLTAQSNIYVSDTANGTAKIAVAYNTSEDLPKPKTAKVTYELGVVSGSTFKSVEDMDDADQAAAIKKWVTVKNGVVTVTKKYKSEITGNKFAVIAKAADFNGNDVESAPVEFTIKTEKQGLGNIVIVQAKQDDEGKYTSLPLDKNGMVAITADQAESTYVKVLKTDAAGTAEYTDADFEDSSNYDLTFSNKKDIKLNENGTLAVTKVIKNVTVSAVANDGGKEKAKNSGKIKITVNYAPVDHAKAKLKITIEDGESREEDFDGNNAYTADGKSSKTIYCVKAYEAAADSSVVSLADKANGLVDYKITAGKGAKIVRTKSANEVYVMMTADTATLNLVGPKVNGKAQTKTYTIKNSVLAGSNKTSAPKIALKKGEKIYAGLADKQEVKFTVAQGVVANANAIVLTAGSDDASEELFAYLKTDEILLGAEEGEVTLNAKNPTDITLIFDEKVSAINKKATLYFDFVKQVKDDSGNVTKQTVLTKTPASVTLKPERLKKSFKLNTKYTMSELDLAKVALTYSGKPEGIKNVAADVTYKGLLNANIKGKINHFTGTDGAFKLEDGKLVLKDPAKAVNNKTDGNNLTGFVKYEVTYRDSDVPQTYITQITVTMKADKKGAKPVRTLKADKVSVINAKDETVTLTVKAGKEPVALVYADFVPNTTFEMITPTKDTLAAGTVTLKLKDAVAKAGVQKGTLTVIAADSFGAEEWAGAVTANDETKKAEVKAKYGIEIKNVQIDVKAVDTKNKVKIDAKDPGLNFSKVDATGDEGAKKYVNTVAYIPTISAKVKGIEADRTTNKKTNKPATPDWITMKKVDGQNKVEITIAQMGYAAYVKAGAKNNKGVVTYPLNGTPVNAAVKFTYAPGVKDDIVTIKITLPKLDTTIIEGAVEPAKNIVVTVNSTQQSVAQGETLTFTAAATKDASPIADATFTWSVTGGATGTSIDTDGKLTVAETETAGTTLTVTATYKDAENKEFKGTATVTVTAKQAATPDTP